MRTNYFMNVSSSLTSSARVILSRAAVRAKMRKPALGQAFTVFKLISSVSPHRRV